MKITMAMVLLLVGPLTAVAAVNSQFAYDEMREEIKEMTLENHNPSHSYKSARKFIMQQVHIDKDKDGYFVQDVYCKIKYRRNVAPNKMPDHKHLNVEHTWPKSRFGSNKGSRKYSKQVSDLHHLFPSDSVTNSRRGSFLFSQFQNDENALFDCPYSKKGFVDELMAYGFEPPSSHKGNVARALFYFAVRYDKRISAHEEFILRQWNIMDPVDTEEIERNDAIESLQGNRNPFVDDSDLSALITDF